MIELCYPTRIGSQGLGPLSDKATEEAHDFDKAGEHMDTQGDQHLVCNKNSEEECQRRRRQRQPEGDDNRKWRIGDNDAAECRAAETKEVNMTWTTNRCSHNVGESDQDESKRPRPCQQK